MAGTDDYGFPSDWASADTPAFYGGDVVTTPTGATGGGTLDKIGQMLGMYSAFETSRLNNRLAETELQARLWGIPSKYQNPQAASGIDAAGGAFVSTKVLMVAGLALGAFLLWRAAK